MVKNNKQLYEVSAFGFGRDSDFVIVAEAESVEDAEEIGWKYLAEDYEASSTITHIMASEIEKDVYHQNPNNSIGEGVYLATFYGDPLYMPHNGQYDTSILVTATSELEAWQFSKKVGKANSILDGKVVNIRLKPLAKEHYRQSDFEGELYNDDFDRCLIFWDGGRLETFEDNAAARDLLDSKGYYYDFSMNKILLNNRCIGVIFGQGRFVDEFKVINWVKGHEDIYSVKEID